MLGRCVLHSTLRAAIRQTRMVGIVLSRIKLGIMTNGRLDGLSDEGRGEMLQFLLDSATFD